MRILLFLSLIFLSVSAASSPLNIQGSAGEFFFRYDISSGSSTSDPTNPTDPVTPTTDADILASFVGVTGYAFSEQIPVGADRGVTAWEITSGTLPAGLSLDPSTGIFAGTPTVAQRNTIVMLNGFSSDGKVSAIAEVRMDIFKPEGQYEPIDFYAHTNHYRLQQLPVPSGMTVDHWNIIFSPPPGIEVIGRNYDGTPTKAGRYPVAVQGFDYLDRETVFLAGYYLVEDGPTFPNIADDVRKIPANKGYQAFATLPPSLRTTDASGNSGSIRFITEVKAGDTLPGTIVATPKTGLLTGYVILPYQTAAVRWKAIDTDGTTGYSNWWNIGTSSLMPDFKSSSLGPYSLTQGVYREISFSTEGTVGSVVFSLASGTLPDGMSIDSRTGTIMGKPTTLGTYEGISLQLAITNSGHTDVATSALFTINVYPQSVGLAVTNAQPGSLNVRTDQSFSATIAATGDVIEPTSISIDPTTPLPQGVSFDAQTGLVSGSIATAGRYTVRFILANGDGRAADVSMRVGVYNPLSIDPVNDLSVRQYDTQNDILDISYDAASIIPFNDGETNPVISLIGSFPPGITYNSGSNRIQGGTASIPGQYGPFAFLIEDGSGQTVLGNQFYITVTERAALALSVTPVIQFQYGVHGAFSPVASLTRPALTSSFPLTYSIQGTLPEGLSLDPSTGVISGTSTNLGAYTGLVLNVQDSDGPNYAAQPQPFGIDVVAAGGLTPKAMAAVTTAVGASVVIPEPGFVNVVGGLAYVSATPLPNGLTFDSATGIISGVATETFPTRNVAIVAKDDADRTASATLSLSVLPPPAADLGESGSSVSLPRLQDANIKVVTYNIIGNATFSVASGALPAGLVLDASTGVIHGSATTEGTTTGIVISATDDATGLTALTPSITITVTARLDLQVSYGQTPIVYSDNNYGFPVRPTVSNAAGSVTFQIVSGRLPEGVSLQAGTGYIVGQTDELGDYPLTVNVVDSDGSLTTATFTLRVSLSGLIAGPSSVDGGTWRVGEHFETPSPAYSNFVPPITYYSTQVMPSSLVLNPSTGTISGSLPTAGDYSFVISAVDVFGRTKSGTATTVKIHILEALAFSTQPQTTATTLYSSVSIAPQVVNVIGNVTFSLTGVIPTGDRGLFFDVASGAITGDASVTGTFGNLAITVTDSHGDVVTSQPFSITVTDRNPLAVSLPASTTTLANIDVTNIATARVQNASYGDQVSYQVSGTLPDGVVFDTTTGTFHGTATVLGDFPGITVAVTDSVGAKATAGPMTIHSVLNGSPIELTVSDVITKIGYPFQTDAASVTNNIGATNFYAQHDVTGISVASDTGALSGKFDTVQDFQYNVVVTDQTNRITSTSARVQVWPLLRIVAPTTVTVSQGTSVSQSVDVTYAAGTVVYSKGDGAWPAGLDVNAATGAITGTTSAPTGTYSGLTIRGTDTFGLGNVDTQVSNAFSIIVNPIDALPVISNVSGNKLAFATVGTAMDPFVPTVKDNKAAKAWPGPLVFSLNHNLQSETGLSFDTATGTISGTPTKSVYYSDLTISAQSERGDVTKTAAFIFGSMPSDPITDVDGQKLAYDKLRVGDPLNFVAPAFTNTFGPVTYSSNLLVTGLSFSSSTGMVTGSPSVVSNGSFWIKVTDAAGRTGTITYTLRVNAVLGLSVSTLTTGLNGGQTYTNINTPTATNVVGTAVYTAAGLPNGLTINSTTGTISGTVSTEYSNGQTFPVTVTLTDGYDGATKTTSYTLTVAMPIAARAGQQTAYTTRVSDAFATVAPVFDNTVGTVTYTQTGKPSALSFSSSTGVLSGTPTATGTSTVVVTAKDSTGRTGTFTYTVNIQAAFTVTATTIVAFSDSPTISSTVPLTVTGAIGTLTYDYVGLPSGLTFNSSTGAVSGTIPSGLGVTTVTASVHDTFGDKSASLSMKVNLAVREHVYWRVIYPPSQTNEMYAYDIDGTRISIAGGGWLTDGNTTTGVNNTGNTTVNVYASSAVAVRKIMIQGYNANNAPSSFTVFFSDDNSTWYQVPAVVFSKSGVYGIGAW